MTNSISVSIDSQYEIVAVSVRRSRSNSLISFLCEEDDPSVPPSGLPLDILSSASENSTVKSVSSDGDLGSVRRHRVKSIGKVSNCCAFFMRFGWSCTRLTRLVRVFTAVWSCGRCFKFCDSSCAFEEGELRIVRRFFFSVLSSVRAFEKSSTLS